MDVHIYTVKANSQTGNMSLYNENTKKAKPQDTELGISKIYEFCQKIDRLTWNYTSES